MPLHGPVQINVHVVCVYFNLDTILFSLRIPKEQMSLVAHKKKSGVKNQWIQQLRLVRLMTYTTVI